jgi:hypothetical protein
MANAIKFLSFKMHPSPSLLWPAPSIKDWTEIAEVLANDKSDHIDFDPDKLIGTTVKILTSYRASTLYTEGRLSIYRHAPKTVGGNEYSGWPSPGLVEEVTLGDWIAEVEYIEL